MNNPTEMYAKVGLESRVMSATPHQLIDMLFDGALSAIRAAHLHLNDGNIAEKGIAIAKATDIVNEGLRAALDMERGGEIAADLDRLYEYMSNQLLQANLKNEVALLEEVEARLQDIASAWREIAPHAETP